MKRGDGTVRSPDFLIGLRKDRYFKATSLRRMKPQAVCHARYGVHESCRHIVSCRMRARIIAMAVQINFLRGIEDIVG